jgi:hypothetical protein
VISFLERIIGDREGLSDADIEKMCRIIPTLTDIEIGRIKDDAPPIVFDTMVAAFKSAKTPSQLAAWFGMVRAEPRESKVVLPDGFTGYLSVSVIEPSNMPKILIETNIDGNGEST